LSVAHAMTQRMSAWLAVRQATVAMDAVERKWARELKLKPLGLTAMLLLARRPGRSAMEIAYFSGQRKQNVGRALRALEKRGLVHPAQVSKRGAEGWSLTAAGVALARRLEARLAAWELIIQRGVDLASLTYALQRTVELLVNRPTEDGWEAGLSIPDESRLDPNWDQHLDAAVLPVEERWVRVWPVSAEVPQSPDQDETK